MTKINKSLELEQQNKLPPSENKQIALALSGIMLCLVLVGLDTAIVNPALPKIVESLQGFSLFAWVTTAYLLTSTSAIPIASKFGDMFGRKKVILYSVLIFLTGSVLCGAAPSMLWLVIFRGIQGSGGGALLANGMALIAELFKDSAQRARWQGYISGTFAMTNLLGPSLGGFITDSLNWRWIFYINIPLGAVALTALTFNVPNSIARGKRKIDWWGAVTLVGMVLSFLLALTWGGQKAPNGYPWISPQILGLFAATIIFMISFIFIEARAPEPILPLQVIALPVMRKVLLMVFCFGALLLGITLFIPLYVQVVLGQSAASSGAITTPLAVTQLMVSIVATQFIGRVGILKIPLVIGGIFVLIGLGLLFSLGVNTPTWQVTLFLIIFGIGLGPLNPAMTITVQETVQRKDLGVGIGSIQFFRSIGSTVGVALIGTFVTTSYTSKISTSPGLATLTPQTLDLIREPQNLLDKQLAGSLSPGIISSIKEAVVEALISGFIISAIFAIIIATLAIFLLPAIRIKITRKRKGEEAQVPVISNEVDLSDEIPLVDRVLKGKGNEIMTSPQTEEGINWQIRLSKKETFPWFHK